MYTFYLCNPDGAPTSFEAFELDGDDKAPERALKLLGEHPGCAYVAVWEGDRPLMQRHRSAAFAQPRGRVGSSSAARTSDPAR
jgi:hypothetical protein